MLHVWNPRGGWWGEGDEKFFVDGEKFPSTIGTGSEDYFGYAWCDPHLFQRPYHCQTMTENNRGHQSVLRWHVADNVPFQKSFEGCIEKYYPNKTAARSMPARHCWYLAPGGDDPFEPAARRPSGTATASQSAVDGGFKVLGKPRATVRGPGDGRTSARQVEQRRPALVDRRKPGDKLDLAVPVEKAGTYRVERHAHQGPRLRHRAVLPGRQEAGRADRPLQPDGHPHRPASPLGTHELIAGEHKLTVEIVGANEKAVKAYMFGLDEIILRPAK